LIGFGVFSFLKDGGEAVMRTLISTLNLSTKPPYLY